MGLLDKVKEAAGSAVEAGKKGAAVAKEKVGDAQLRRKADDLAKQLGYLVAGGTSAGPEADALVSQIKDLEEQIAADADKPADAETPAESEPEAPGE
jgi:hypothetical protein